MSWINHQAMEFAWEFEADSKEQRAVLLSFARHCDKRGYSWPAVETIANVWTMDRKTVRRQIASLLVRRALCPTKKRRGATRQTKVYRLPKITWGSGGAGIPFENGQSVAKGGQKRGVSGGQFPPNKEEGTKNNPEKRAEGNSFGLLPPEVRKIFFSDSSDSPKREEGEHPWRDEVRALYPGTDVDQHILRIEESARKKGVTNLRAFGLACLRKHPPGKKRRRKRPAINYEAELEASRAKADKENAA